MVLLSSIFTVILGLLVFYLIRIKAVKELKENINLLENEKIKTEIIIEDANKISIEYNSEKSQDNLKPDLDSARHRPINNEEPDFSPIRTHID